MYKRSKGANGTGRVGGHDTAGLLPLPRGAAGGLTSAEVARRTGRGEVNDMPSRSGRTVGDVVRANFCTRINAIIGVLLVVALIVGPLHDALFGVVILANTLIGVVLEMRAKRTLDRLAAVGEARPTVRRDGRSLTLAPARIVLGDVVELGPGDRIVVDGTVLEAKGLEVDASLLTGEAEPVLKRPGDDVMSGSFVVSGSGAFVARRVGRATRAARLAEEAHRRTLVTSELRDGINTLITYVTYALVPVGIVLFLGQLGAGDGGVSEAARRTIAGIVPMVPEGLVLLTAVVFAAGVVRLGKRDCLVQELPAIEGLARVDTVCLDKTGTLTETSMDVSVVHEIEQGVRVGDVLGALGALDDRPEAGMRAVIDAYPAPKGWTEKESVPFSAARRWSGATLTDAAGTTVTWLLGAADALLAPGHSVLVAVDAYGERGLRVLLLARCSLPLSEVLAAPERGPYATAPVALVVIAQRVREEAPAALRYFAEQGVETKVISGDNALSVGAVARGLDLPGGDRHLDARQLPDETSQLSDVVADHAVFGRVSPHRKLDIVTALRSRGRTVAMMGDGVNDVLALKAADVAVCMGTGSPAARAEAQIVLLDDDFSSLPSVVAEGRRVIGNIEGVAHLFLTKTTYSALLAVLVVLVDVPYPFLPRQLTLIGALTIGIPAFVLALAPNAVRPQGHFVRRVLRFAVPCGVVTALATMGSYAVAHAVYDGDREAAASVAALTLFLVGLCVLSIVARPRTWWRVLLVLAMTLCFAVVQLVPSLRTFFQLELVGTAAPCAAVGIAVVAGALLESAWRIARRGSVDAAERDLADGGALR